MKQHPALPAFYRLDFISDAKVYVLRNCYKDYEAIYLGHRLDMKTVKERIKKLGFKKSIFKHARWVKYFYPKLHYKHLIHKVYIRDGK